MNTAEQDKVLQNFRAIADAIADINAPVRFRVVARRTSSVASLATNLSSSEDSRASFSIMAS